jgi:hypothetical protein
MSCSLLLASFKQLFCLDVQNSDHGSKSVARNVADITLHIWLSRISQVLPFGWLSDDYGVTKSLHS